MTQPVAGAAKVDRSRYLVYCDPGTEVRFYVPQAQLGQVHGVLGQVTGHRERIDVLEAGEPQPHPQVLEHGVAFASKYLDQQKLRLSVGHHSCARQMQTLPQEEGEE